jgi:uncharacterized protein YggU (UPF0235/DUF167 family)
MGAITNWSETRKSPMPRYAVKVIAGARTRSIDQLPDGSFRIKTTTAPEKGRANEDVVDILADHFRVPRSHVEIIAGHTSAKKIVKITVQ